MIGPQIPLINGRDPATVPANRTWGSRPGNDARNNSARLITFQRLTRQKPDLRYDLYLMPESYSVDWPARVTVVQTRGGAFTDHFGQGLGTVTLAGTTGWGQGKNNATGVIPDPADGSQPDGYDRWVGLRSFFEKWFDAKQNDLTGEVTLHLLNWHQSDFYVVQPLALPRLSRSSKEPLLFRYDLQMTILGKVAESAYTGSRDYLADLGTRIDRANLIDARLQEQNALVAQIAASIFAGQVTDAQVIPFMIAHPVPDYQASQALVDRITRDQAPPLFVTPVDSPAGVVSRTQALADKITRYANHETSFIDTSLGEVQATVNGWRTVLDAANYAVNLPRVYAREVKETLCAVQSLLLYPQLFRNSAVASITDLAGLLLDSGCGTTLRGLG